MVWHDPTERCCRRILPQDFHKQYRLLCGLMLILLPSISCAGCMKGCQCIQLSKGCSAAVSHLACSCHPPMQARLLLLQIAPKEDELRAFQGYSGTFEELSPPEQFLYIMASVPRLTNKINILILIHQFEVSHTPACTLCSPSLQDFFGLPGPQLSGPCPKCSQRSASTPGPGSAYQMQQDVALDLQGSVQAATASTDCCMLHSRLSPSQAGHCMPGAARRCALPCRVLSSLPGPQSSASARPAARSARVNACRRCCAPCWPQAMPSTRAPRGPMQRASSWSRC